MIPELSLCCIENPIPAFKAAGVGTDPLAAETNHTTH